VQYQFAKRGPLNGLWAGGNWRYDSGQVAGAMPFAVNSTTPVDLTRLTYDQQAQLRHRLQRREGHAHSGFQSCLPSEYSSSLISIPAPGTENDDHNPPRIAPRSLFDASVGQDNIFHKERYKGKPEPDRREHHR